MEKVRLGLIGCGGMGRNHLGYLDKVDGVELTAVSDTVAELAESTASQYGGKAFTDGHELIGSGLVDAILIATPHYFHPEYAIAGFEAGLHVLTEKPVAVTAKAAAAVNAAHQNHPRIVYSAMFQQRARPLWKAVKRMVASGEVGELIRVSWTITNWFRTQAYFDSGGWRATWKGEGGGVLINQCPHNLDLFQWFVGMPSKVSAICGIGKYHDIEVDDEVLATMEFDNSAVGTFITSTGEAPGINRLEIVGDNGTLIAEGGKLTFLRNQTPVREFRENSPERFATPAVDRYEITPGGKDDQHRAITQNFINAILHGEELIAGGEEGIHGLELGNAMLMSGLTHQPVSIPTDREAFEKLLEDLISKSTFQKKRVKQAVPAGDLGSSF